jgi:hypothetical protein
VIEDVMGSSLGAVTVEEKLQSFPLILRSPDRSLRRGWRSSATPRMSSTRSPARA